jgi:NADPH:quinone reductase-like Zn-dependent oxidoreductase
MPAHAFTKAPAGCTHAEAATLPCAGVTAWRPHRAQFETERWRFSAVEGDADDTSDPRPSRKF